MAVDLVGTGEYEMYISSKISIVTAFTFKRILCFARYFLERGLNANLEPEGISI